jgi:hypothetical protein
MLHGISPGSGRYQEEGSTMTIGGGIGLIILGAILVYAVEIQVAGIDINAVGYILMLGGLIGIVLGLVWWQQGRTRVVHRETPVVEERIREY